jgi:hypothetical protein
MTYARLALEIKQRRVCSCVSFIVCNSGHGKGDVRPVHLPSCYITYTLLLSVVVVKYSL